MDFSAPETAPILLWTLMRGAALAVLATEAIFLWTRRREPEPSAAQAAARLFWAATPAILLAGLALWCLASISAPTAAGPAIAQFVPR
jgi:heme/copper-type cytochrome/quinol oxidase subunit 2